MISASCRTVPCSTFPGPAFSLQLTPGAAEASPWVTVAAGFAPLRGQHGAVGTQTALLCGAISAPAPLGWVRSYGSSAPAESWPSAPAGPAGAGGTREILPRASTQPNCVWGADVCRYKPCPCLGRLLCCLTRDSSHCVLFCFSSFFKG